MIARVHTSRYLYSPLRFNGQVYKTAYNNKNSQSQKATNTRVGIIRAYVATFPTATRAAKATRAVHLIPRRFGRNRNRQLPRGWNSHWQMTRRHDVTNRPYAGVLVLCLEHFAGEISELEALCVNNQRKSKVATRVLRGIACCSCSRRV